MCVTSADFEALRICRSTLVFPTVVTVTSLAAHFERRDLYHVTMTSITMWTVPCCGVRRLPLHIHGHRHITFP